MTKNWKSSGAKQTSRRRGNSTEGGGCDPLGEMSTVPLCGVVCQMGQATWHEGEEGHLEPSLGARTVQAQGTRNWHREGSEGICWVTE